MTPTPARKTTTAKQPLGLDGGARRVPEPDPITTPAPKRRAPRKATAENGAGPPPATPATPPASAEGPGKRTVHSFGIEADLLDQLRAAATYLGAYMPDAGIRSMSDIVEGGVRRELADLVASHNDGKPFPPVARSRRGRPPAM